MKGRLLICARSYPPDIAGGGEISTALLAKSLVDRGVDVHVLTMTDGDSTVESVDGVDVHRIECPNIYWSYRAGQQAAWRKALWHSTQAFRRIPPAIVCQAIERLSPTLVHTSTIEDFGPGTWNWCRKQGIATVHTLRSYTLLHRNATLYDAQQDREHDRDLLSYPKRRASKWCDGVIGISHHILNAHLEAGFFQQSRSAVIGNPVELGTAERKVAADSRIQLGVLGRLSPEKGIEPLLSVMRNLNNVSRWQMTIAGEGSHEMMQRLRHQAEGLPIEFVGWQPSEEYLSGLDLLIVPSRWQEPFGRVVIEAHAVGVPVLALRRGGLPELVDEGKTGWIVDDWTTEAIEKVIDRCRSIDSQFIKETAKQFAAAKIAERHERFYETVLA